MKPTIIFAVISLATVWNAEAKTVIQCSFDQDPTRSVTLITQDYLPKDELPYEVESHSAAVIFKQNAETTSTLSETLNLHGTATRIFGEIAYEVNFNSDESISLNEIVYSASASSSGMIGQITGYYTIHGSNEYLSCKKSYPDECEAPRVCGMCHCSTG